MDVASVLGFVGGTLLLILSIVMADGASLGAFVDGPSIIMVFGGTFAATLIAVPLSTAFNLSRLFRRVFINRPDSFPRLIEQIVDLAETARRQGLLALERRIDEITHPFLATAVQLAVDGVRPEAIEEILRSEMEAVANRHRSGKHVVEQMAKFAPAFGMVGTLIGLVIMLANVKTPDAIAPGMAVALITTLYGVLLANLVCLPFAEKLASLSRHELTAMEIIVRGVLAIQSGDHPRMIEQRLLTYIPRGQWARAKPPQPVAPSATPAGKQSAAASETSESASATKHSSASPAAHRPQTVPRPKSVQLVRGGQVRSQQDRV
jgi:chemotaxis protein MotA